MKILSKLSLIIAFIIVAVPLRASALDRMVARYHDDNAYLLEGALGGEWHQLTSGVNFGSVSLAGDRISLLDQGNSQKPVTVKEPAWNSPWEWTYFSDGSQPLASKALSGQLSNGQYRLLVLRADGSVVMKDGPWNAGWWSGTVEASGVSDIVIGGDRIGIITSGGEFKVKQLTPGQFSHPANEPWHLEATGAASAAMVNSWIAYRDTSNNVYAKDGAVTAPWFSGKAVIYDNATTVRVGGNRLCVLKTGGNVECKEGSLGASSVMTFGANATDMKVSASRFVVVQDGHTLRINEGSLTHNSGWREAGFPVSAVEIN